MNLYGQAVQGVHREVAMSVLSEQGTGLDVGALQVSMREVGEAFELLSRVVERFDDAALPRGAKQVWQAAGYAAQVTVVLEGELWGQLNRVGEVR